MELSERCIQTLEKEGFVQVFEWSGEPGTVYPEQSASDKVAIFVSEGSIEWIVSARVYDLRAGDRHNVANGDIYSGTVGQFGCQLVIGEMS